MERLTSGTPRPAVRTPTAQVAPKVLAPCASHSIRYCCHGCAYQWGRLGRAAGRGECWRQREERTVGSLAKRESDMVVKYSPQSLKSKEWPITERARYSTREVCMRPFDRSCLPFPRLFFGLTIRCPKRPRWGRSVRWPYPQQGRLNQRKGNAEV